MIADAGTSPHRPVRPLLAGWIYDATGSYDSAFMLFLVLFVPTGIAMRWLRPPGG